ncbi:MAG: 2-hydroxyacyl-CoA dehydratase [Spirochaetes bacterium]|nr:MAG: 2-hydroxyacyl-CoA dehydratase [Spirochaetota bacterium]
MKQTTEALIKDEYTGAPSKRALAYVQSKRENKAPVVGIYCAYAPLELVRAMDAVPALLCAFANGPIEKAEAVLPSNLCPLIKSSYGFIISDTCPFFSLSDAVIAETTCDGKKKMFELITGYKPLHVMDLPQVPDAAEAEQNWTAMIGKLKAFLENTFKTTITDKRIEEEIKDTNEKNRMMRKLFSYASRVPSAIGWSELYDIIFTATPSSGRDLKPLLDTAFARLEERVARNECHGAPGAPRVLVTGSPLGGDATKVFRVIEEAGGVVNAIDNCTGMKCFMDDIEENTGNPLAALARRYLKIPCSCMTPNRRRLDTMDCLVAQFKPDVVVDVVLHACHSYNIESHKLGKHVMEKHGLPFLKIVTDYSTGDIEQLRTRIEAVLESARARMSAAGR